MYTYASASSWKTGGLPAVLHAVLDFLRDYDTCHDPVANKYSEPVLVLAYLWSVLCLRVGLLGNLPAAPERHESLFVFCEYNTVLGVYIWNWKYWRPSAWVGGFCISVILSPWAMVVVEPAVGQLADKPAEPIRHSSNPPRVTQFCAPLVEFTSA